MGKIYKKVQTDKDFEIYYGTLTPSWLEMNYTLECILGDVSRYIVFDKNNTPVGTVEIIPYEPLKSSDLDTYFPFKDEKVILDNIERVAEFDSVAIHPEYRKTGNLERIGYTLIEHARINKIKYGIGLMNPLLYLALRNTYKIPVRKIGKKISKNNKSSVYPIIFEAEQVYTNLEKYPWLYNIYELENNLARRVIYKDKREKKLLSIN